MLALLVFGFLSKKESKLMRICLVIFRRWRRGIFMTELPLDMLGELYFHRFL